jgi:hypothetical protein
MKPAHRIVLEYACDQNWQDMKPTMNSRHCELCSKTVIDFRHKSITEIRKYSKGQENLCGHFTVEQLEPDLISFEKLVSPFRKYSVIILSFISIELAGAPSSKGTNKIKITQTISPIQKVEFDNVNHNFQEDFYIKDKIEVIPIQEVSKKRRRLYFSKRFPFIHYRQKVRTAGRYWNPHD